MTVLLVTVGTQAFAGAQRQRQLDEDHIINKVNGAISTIEQMSERHEAMTKEEILADVQSVIDAKKGSVDRKEREAYLTDAKKFMNLLSEQETESDILIVEQDLVNELNDFEYSAYMDATSQVGGEGAIVGLIFSLPFDLVAAPFQAIHNEIQYNQTEWSREMTKFLIKY